MTKRARSLQACAIAVLIASLGTSLAACFVGIDESLISRDAGASANDATAPTGVDAGEDANATADAGSDAAAEAAPLTILPCGTSSCTPPTSVCCADVYGDTDRTKGSCTTIAGCRTGDYFECTDTHDCDYVGSRGSICCVVRLSGGAWTRSTCMASCKDSILCDGPSDTSCPSPQQCFASQEFPHAFECADP